MADSAEGAASPSKYVLPHSGSQDRPMRRRLKKMIRSAAKRLARTSVALPVPFRFFLLPRELRDLIYDHLYEERCTPPSEKDKYSAVRYSGQVRVVRARLICKQFCTEFDKMLTQARPLYLEDHIHLMLHEPETCLDIPAWTVTTTSLFITFMFGIDWLRLLLAKLPHVEDIACTIQFERRPGAGELWDRRIEQGMEDLRAAIPLVKHVRAACIQREEDRVRKVEEKITEDAHTTNADGQPSDEGASDEVQPPAQDADMLILQSDPTASNEAAASREEQVAEVAEEEALDSTPPAAFPLERCVAVWTTEDGLMRDEAEVKELRELVAASR